jgi:hypothetical protein
MATTFSTAIGFSHFKASLMGNSIIAQGGFESKVRA